MTGNYARNSSGRGLRTVDREREIIENGHIHTTYSDGLNPIHDLVKEAAALGLKVIGFTDHWDPTDVSEGNYNRECLNSAFNESYELRRRDIEAYAEDNPRLERRSEESLDLEIAEGAELEYYPGREEELEQAIQQANFDYVNLSVHYNGHGEDYREMDPGSAEEAEQVIGSYFSNLRDSFKFADKVDAIKTICHPDGIERNEYLRGCFEEDELYESMLEEEYKTIIHQASQNNVLPELNGRILLRKSETAWLNALSESNIPYAVGTDTHRVGAKSKFDWSNETQARLNMLEMKIPELGREPEQILEDVNTSQITVPYPILESFELGTNVREKIS